MLESDPAIDIGLRLVCTLIVIFRGVQGAPLIVAANRDEYFDRPAEGPARRDLGSIEGPGGAIVESPGGAVIAPLDLRAGGTWLGVNAEGVFAAVTNLRNDNPDPQRRSRGLVVMDALREASAERAADAFKALPEEGYNPFNCFVGDRERAFHLLYRDVPTVTELGPGVHVIGNLDPGEERAPVAKIERVRRAALGAIAGAGPGGIGTAEALERLGQVCREHETGGGELGDTCVHMGTYGTRSSTLLLMAEERSASRLLFADGPPCETDYVEYEEFSALLCERSQKAGYVSGEIAARKAS